MKEVESVHFQQMDIGGVGGFLGIFQATFFLN